DDDAEQQEDGESRHGHRPGGSVVLTHPAARYGRRAAARRSHGLSLSYEGLGVAAPVGRGGGGFSSACSSASAIAISPAAVGCRGAASSRPCTKVCDVHSS